MKGRDIQSEFHTVLPQDAIPAIFNPEFVSVAQAYVHKDAPMIAVSINGEHHAYSMYMPVATTW